MGEQAPIACGLVLRKGKALLVKEAYGWRRWVLPGGYVEPGETYAAAAVREVREETGLLAKIGGLVCVRERADQICLVYQMEMTGGELLEGVPGEIEAVGWYGADAPLGEMDEVSRLVVQRALEEESSILTCESRTCRDGNEALYFI